MSKPVEPSNYKHLLHFPSIGKTFKRGEHSHLLVYGLNY